MVMLHKTLIWIMLPLLCLGALLALAGCGALSGTPTSGSYGADAGPWPTGQPRPGTTTRTDDVPSVPLVVVLQGKTSEGEELRVDIAQVDLKFKDRWLTIANRDGITKNAKLPFSFTQKGGTLLVAKTTVPKQAYSHVRVLFVDTKTVLVKGETSLPLAVESSALELGKWAMENEKTNSLVLTIDGAKVKEGEKSATLPAGALTVKTGVPTGAVNGKVQPAMPTAKVEVYWGDTTVQFGSAVPAAKDGAFAIGNLPAGSYKVKISAPGQHPTNPLDPVQVAEKAVNLEPIQLVPDGDG
ncbi:MAG: carboxypeptidase-like regulatory domain-containing protein [Armatimonadota bacterium]